MGWTFMREHPPSADTYFREQLGHRYTVLDAATVNLSEYYAAIRDNDTKEVQSAVVTLGQCYSDPEVVVGTVQDLANTLLELGCTFETGEDPKYEHTGELWRGAPSLGIHVTAYDGYHPYVAQHHIDQAISTSRSRAALIERLQDLLGRCWQEAIDRLNAQASR